MAGGGIPRILEQGWAATFWTARDDLPAFSHKFSQRMERANENFKETLPYTIALLLLVQVLGLGSEITAAGAWTYFLARVLYIPIYLFGIPLVRSFIWMVAMGGLVMVAWPIIQLP
tara:strand:- start:12511 stop:12858 length:348 start_codon:yes stop_codon:yes gene_type:complete